ncbi:S41 family peptidase [Lacihabitans sp. CS3-21]|uniref:S41 family peptidase n=1 Tax=Lacihabitans sp. CS3-21 TaxID=2487332 RepID=UPI0020CD4D3B|nr:S41 family peptidase [Lacihabitans sp. CS3-21]MCP9745213.1 S41 family peptidase [Lacihabitans sp. CS3-21]
MSYQNDKKSIILPIAVAVSLVLGIILGASFFGKKTFISNSGGTNSVFKEVLMHINKSYVDEVNIDSLSQYGIEKMLEKLDPHTAFLPPQDAELASADLHNGFDGIGVEFNIFNDSLFVVSPLVGGPSEAIGIKTGDIILKADTVNLTGKNLNSNVVFKSLRGPRNSIVKLTVKRKGTKSLLSFNVKRDKIPTYSVDAAYLMADKKTGYIKVNRFAETTYDEFKLYLGQLKAKGMTQLMLDLRGNPGGYMDRATDMVDELVGGNDVIVYTKGKDRSNNYEVKASKSGIFEKGKIVVLVDEGSASASEIVSGSLQDFDRATIVGRRTFGKGLVQAPIQLSDGSELRLTISRYYIPSGRSIQKPYELGKSEDYMEDMHNRYTSKELFVKDSIKSNQKLKFKTKGGRTVYGGGGITPDIFVPQDTSYYTTYLVEMFSKNIFREYSLNFTVSNTAKIQAMGFDNYLKNFQVDEKMLADVKSLGTKNQVRFSEKDYAKSKAFIKTHVKALIARNIWKNNEKSGLTNEFYQIINQDDSMIKIGLTKF